MRSINQLILCGLITTSLFIAGCSTAPKTSSKKITTEQEPIPLAQGEKIDLSKLKTVDENSPIEDIHHYAVALMTNQRYDEAEQKLLMLSNKHPELAGPFTNLGIIYFQTAKFDKARDTFTQAIALKANNAVAYDYIARMDRDAGKFNEASENYNKAITADPNYAPAHRNLGILYDLYLAKPAEALKHYQQYQNLVTEPDKMVAIWIKDLSNRIGEPASADEEEN